MKLDSEHPEDGDRLRWTGARGGRLRQGLASASILGKGCLLGHVLRLGDETCFGSVLENHCFANLG